jgi:hypothetical protein
MATILCCSNKLFFTVHCILYIKSDYTAYRGYLLNLEITYQVRRSITDTNYIITCILTA